MQVEGRMPPRYKWFGDLKASLTGQPTTPSPLKASAYCNCSGECTSRQVSDQLHNTCRPAALDVYKTLELLFLCQDVLSKVTSRVFPSRLQSQSRKLTGLSPRRSNDVAKPSFPIVSHSIGPDTDPKLEAFPCFPFQAAGSIISLNFSLFLRLPTSTASSWHTPPFQDTSRAPVTWTSVALISFRVFRLILFQRYFAPAAQSTLRLHSQRPSSPEMAANAVALPDSDDDSPRPGLLSPWRPPRRSLSSGGRSSPFVQSRSAAWRDEAINNIEKLRRRIHRVWNGMTTLQKILTCIGLVALNVLGILFLVFNERIFGWLEPLAERWKNTTGGWTVLWAIVFLCAFPPMIGYSTAATTAGFVYGVWEGWFILATATIAGSFCSFIVSRSILRKWVERMTANDKRFAAFSLILKHDGLKLLAMIRLCPLPYSLSNGAMSTFPTVTPSAYALATAMVTPKLLVPAFIGSRLAIIARTREKMTMGDRAINYSSIALGAIVGTATGFYIYRQTMARAKELEDEEINNVRESTRRTGHAPPDFSDDPEAQTAVNTLTRDDDQIDYFDDSSNEQYRDETDDDNDIFGKGDGDENEPVTANIGMHQQKK